MTRRSTTIAAIALWTIALVAIAGLFLARRRPATGPDSSVVDPAFREALLSARRVVVIEGPPDDDPRGVTTWDAGLTSWATAGIVDDLRSEGFRRALGSVTSAPPVVSRVRTLGRKGRDPTSPVVPSLHADALVFVALQSLRAEAEGDTIRCEYAGRAWLRRPADGLKSQVAWDRSGHLRVTRTPGTKDPAFEPKRTAPELARRWGLDLIGPDLAARMGRAGQVASASPSSLGFTATTDPPGTTP